MMFTASARINCFIILKLGEKKLINAVAILYILTSRTRFRSWSFYRYRKRFGDLDHCSPGPSVNTDDRRNRENKEFRIY